MPYNILFILLSVTGLFMQNQGSVQCILNMKHYNSTPQRVADMPRFTIVPTDKTLFDFNNVEKLSNCAILFEKGIPEEVLEELRSKGHVCKYGYNRVYYVFGTVSLIRSRIDTRTGKRVLSAACDGRTDGQACGY
jgi:gamma-glutamyltranspeptidase/glutathione hydrolase